MRWDQMTCSTMTMTDPRRGEVWWVDFDPSVGSEQRKVRPAVVVGVDGLGILPLRIVVPITTRRSPSTSHPWWVDLEPSPENGLSNPSVADALQVKSLSLERFDRRMGAVAANELDEIASAVALCIGFPGH